jgi:hypothetical protein
VPTLIEKQAPPSYKPYVKDDFSDDEEEPYDDAVFSSEEEKDKGESLLDSIMPVTKPAPSIPLPEIQAPIIRYNPLTAIQQNKSTSSMIYENEPLDSYNNTFAMQNVYIQD